MNEASLLETIFYDDKIAHRVYNKYIDDLRYLGWSLSFVHDFDVDTFPYKDYVFFKIVDENKHTASITYEEIGNIHRHLITFSEGTVLTPAELFKFSCFVNVLVHYKELKNNKEK